MFLILLLKTFLIGFSIVGLSVGFIAFLYKSIHFIEEYPVRAKERIKLLVYAVWGMHIILLFREFSFLLIGFSLVCQLLFYNLLEDYPNIETAGAGFISAVVFAFINHMFFLSSMLKNRCGLFEIFFYFFVIVWSVPISFFLSLTANDEVISIAGSKKPIRRTLAGKVIDAILSRHNVWEDR
ncbi:hypothetical protein NEAUS04_1492 [Nematocida ausubeli]|uniref:Protein TEX261 n=1 Tax=Nematocida ausubeli (strain ATCC PRA-371 / ERTm2) TaxID=1913371 RepID=H8ZBP1_NEMA1|nr:uncharacterized protein NESG_01159 [Nematocida ausubeli]EHY66294.1 hypothetical protein NERG_00990 [Nematocida ausubeli]KAI5135223.1 hypothetical protein NEAUS06_1440 [Nematocida ausubeli]KAI5136021.1 hypothetical protein NEAUS07_1429 [Nematocida ausubeli]KAI5147855.1 hypothetical protein NEAUS05_1136 [Nematocida ausubeli]KAI5160932.1 hypothetical protein NEAUS03_1425 [Nematocida ausubeli]